MLRRLARSYSRKAYTREFEEYLRFLECGTPDELAAALLAAFRMRQSIMNRDLLPYPFPTEVLDGAKIPTEQDLVRLSFQSLAIIQLKKQFRARGTVAGGMAAGGLTVWQYSMRALTAPHYLSYGREIWRELLRGKPMLREMNEVMAGENAAIDDIDRIYWVPRSLAPEDDGPPPV